MTKKRGPGRPRHEVPNEKVYILWPKHTAAWLRLKGKKEKVIKMSEDDKCSICEYCEKEIKEKDINECPKCGEPYPFNEPDDPFSPDR